MEKVLHSEKRTISKRKIILIIICAVLIVGIAVWFSVAAHEKAKFESDLSRITTEDVIFVSMSYSFTPSFQYFGTEDPELIAEAVDWVRSTEFHSCYVTALSFDELVYNIFPTLQPAGRHAPGYCFTLSDGTKITIHSWGDRIRYNDWYYTVDDTELIAKFRALYDSIKDNEQTRPH